MFCLQKQWEKIKKQILMQHGIRNVLLPAITLQFASISEIFGGSILAEQVFSYPGLGQIAVTAGLGGDMPLFDGYCCNQRLFCRSREFIGRHIISYNRPSY